MNYKLFLLLFLVGFFGIVALSFVSIPNIPPNTDLSIETLRIITILQSAVFLIVSIFVGMRYGSKIGLGSPICENLIEKKDFRAIFSKSYFMEILAVATAVTLLLITYELLASQQIITASNDIYVPLFAKILYGGITEELLIRFGLMSGVAYMLYLALKNRLQNGQKISIIFAIIVSSLIFGVTHIPILQSTVGVLTFETTFLVLATNGMAGMLFGALFWRRGLEAAIFAHILAHIFYSFFR